MAHLPVCSGILGNSLPTVIFPEAACLFDGRILETYHPEFVSEYTKIDQWSPTHHAKILAILKDVLRVHP